MYLMSLIKIYITAQGFVKDLCLGFVQYTQYFRKKYYSKVILLLFILDLSIVTYSPSPLYIQTFITP